VSAAQRKFFGEIAALLENSVMVTTVEREELHGYPRWDSSRYIEFVLGRG